MTKTYSTRVQAPAIIQPEVIDAISKTLETNDAARVNPSGPCVDDVNARITGQAAIIY